MKITGKATILSLALLLLLITRASAQNNVTPTLAHTPTGQLIPVNNGPGDQFAPHVSGDLVCYVNEPDPSTSTISYFNLATKINASVPNDGSVDFPCDVRGSTIVFTRSSIASGIFTFGTSNPNTPPIEIAPQANAIRGSSNIGDQTIVWEEFSSTTDASAIVAYDRASATTQQVSPSPLVIDQNPGISPDGTVVVWERCPTLNSRCAIWKATLSNGTWTAQHLVSQVGGAQTHPDTDGTIIAYSSNGLGSNRIVWQPVGGGMEQVLNLPGNSVRPSVSGQLITFETDPTGSGSHEIAIYNVATNTLYNLTADLVAAGLYPAGLDSTLNNISVTPDGKVRVVWSVQEVDFNVYAYTFNLNLPARVAYVADAGSSSVSVIDTSKNTVVATIQVGAEPLAIATTHDLAHAYVANLGAESVSVIDTTTKAVVKTVPVGMNPVAIAITPSGATAYVANFGADSVSAIDTTTNAVVKTVPVGRNPVAVAITPNGATAYVANLGGSSVSVIDTATNAVVKTVPVGDDPISVAITPNGATAYVANLGESSVSVIDTATNAVVKTVPVGRNPVAVAITPNGAAAYVANLGANSVSVIEMATNAVVKTVPVGDDPISVAITPNSAGAYVANSGSNSVSVISTGSNTEIATVTVESSPISLTIAPSGTSVYVASIFANSVSVIDTASNTVSATVAVGKAPVKVSISP